MSAPGKRCCLANWAADTGCATGGRGDDRRSCACLGKPTLSTPDQSGGLGWIQSSAQNGFRRRLEYLRPDESRCRRGARAAPRQTREAAPAFPAGGAAAVAAHLVAGPTTSTAALVARLLVAHRQIEASALQSKRQRGLTSASDVRYACPEQRPTRILQYPCSTKRRGKGAKSGKSLQAPS